MERWWSSSVKSLANRDFLFQIVQYPWIFQLPITLILLVFHLPGMVLNLVFQQVKNLSGLYDFLLKAVTRETYHPHYVQEKESGNLRDFLNPASSLLYGESANDAYVLSSSGPWTFLSAAWRTVKQPLTVEYHFLYNLLEILHKVILLGLMLPLTAGKCVLDILHFAIEFALVVQYFIVTTLPRLVFNLPIYVLGKEKPTEDKPSFIDRLVLEVDIGGSKISDSWWFGIVRSCDNSFFLHDHTRYPWLLQFPISVVLWVCHLPGMLLNIGIQQFKKIMTLYDFVLNIVTRGWYRHYDSPLHFQEGTAALQDLLDPALPFFGNRHKQQVFYRHDTLAAFMNACWDIITLSLSPQDNVITQSLQILHKIALMALVVPLSVGKLAFNIVDFALEQVLVMQCLITVMLPRMILNAPLYVVEKFEKKAKPLPMPQMISNRAVTPRLPNVPTANNYGALPIVDLSDDTYHPGIVHNTGSAHLMASKVDARSPGMFRQ